jgi:hypothetical protein
LAASPCPSGTENKFITQMGEIVIAKYNDLPESSVIKRKDSLVANRIIMSNTEVIKTLYQLELHSNKGIKDYFF